MIGNNLNTYALTYKINDRIKTVDVRSKYFRRGENIFEFSDANLYKNTELLQQGYVIVNLPKNWYGQMLLSITKYIQELLAKNGVKVDNNFCLENYHVYVNDEIHQKVVDEFRAGMFGVGGIDLKHLGIPYEKFDEFVNASIQSSRALSCHYKRYGVSLKHFWIRIIRPNSNDNNPPHKDSHLKRNRDMVITFLPVVGCNENSSLPIIPCSHIELESDYIISASPSYVNGKRFNVPAIVHRDKGLDLITPNPQQGQLMIFTPYLIHGGGVNYNKNTTRISIETRFY